MTKYVYSFGGGTADGDGKMKDVLGGKGAGLAEMSRAKLPVPPGFTVSTEVCNLYFKNGNQVPAFTNRPAVLTVLSTPPNGSLNGGKNSTFINGGARFDGQVATVMAQPAAPSPAASKGSPLAVPVPCSSTYRTDAAATPARP